MPEGLRGDIEQYINTPPQEGTEQEKLDQYSADAQKIVHESAEWQQLKDDDNDDGVKKLREDGKEYTIGDQVFHKGQQVFCRNGDGRYEDDWYIQGVDDFGVSIGKYKNGKCNVATSIYKDNFLKEQNYIKEKLQKEAKMLMPEIEETQHLVEKLIDQMYNRIQDCSYKVIIGDEPSGRIPTLMFHLFLKELYQLKGLDQPKTFFIAGKRTPQEHNDYGVYSRIKKYLEQDVNISEKVDNNDRVLIVTEFMETGSTLDPVAKVVGNDLRKPFDIVSLSIQNNFNRMSRINVGNKGNLRYGNPEDDNTLFVAEKPDQNNSFFRPAVFHRNDLSGMKDTSDDQRLHARKYFDDRWRQEDKNRIGGWEEFIQSVREESPEVAEKLSREHLHEPKSELKKYFRAREDLKKAGHRLVEYFLNIENQRNNNEPSETTNIPT